MAEATNEDNIIFELRKRLSGRFAWLLSELELLFRQEGGSECGSSVRIGLKKRYGDGYSSCIIHGQLSAASENMAIPPAYRAVLNRFNGAKLFAIDLYGVPDDESNQRRCLSLLSANEYWVHGYKKLPKDIFLFGSRFFSYDENIGYFYDDSNQVFSAKKSGEIFKSWPSFDAMLRDEWDASKRVEIEARDRLSH